MTQTVSATTPPFPGNVGNNSLNSPQLQATLPLMGTGNNSGLMMTPSLNQTGNTANSAILPSTLAQVGNVITSNGFLAPSAKLNQVDDTLAGSNGLLVPSSPLGGGGGVTTGGKNKSSLEAMYEQVQQAAASVASIMDSPVKILPKMPLSDEVSLVIALNIY